MTTDAQDLFRLHYLDLVRLAMRLVDDQETAEDLVQDVFLGLARRPVPMADPPRYLRTAVLNRSRSALRRRKLARAGRPIRPVAPQTDSADVPALQGSERRRLLQAINALPRRQREVIVLRYYEDLSVARIAEVLGIRPGAVSSALNRALGTLSRTAEDRHGD